MPSTDLKTRRIHASAGMRRINSVPWMIDIMIRGGPLTAAARSLAGFGVGFWGICMDICTETVIGTRIKIYRIGVRHADIDEVYKIKEDPTPVAALYSLSLALPILSIMASRLFTTKPVLLSTVTILGLGSYYGSRSFISTAHAESSEPPKVFGSFGFTTLRLRSSTAVNHNTKRLVFEFADPHAVSGLSLTCMLMSMASHSLITDSVQRRFSPSPAPRATGSPFSDPTLPSISVRRALPRNSK